MKISFRHARAFSVAGKSIRRNYARCWSTTSINTKTSDRNSIPATVYRRRRRCLFCKNSSFPVEAALGLDTPYTEGLKRLVGRSVGFWSYRLAAENLYEFCGIRVSHTLLGDLAQKTADEIAAQLPNRPDLRDDFQEAEGEVEFTVDGTCINTRDSEGQRAVASQLAFPRRCDNPLPLVAGVLRTKRRPTGADASRPKATAMERHVPVCGLGKQGGISRALSSGISPLGGERSDFGVGRRRVVDLESCFIRVRQNGGVPGHLPCLGARRGLRQDIVRKRIGFYGMAGPYAFGAAVGRLGGNGSRVVVALGIGKIVARPMCRGQIAPQIP